MNIIKWLLIILVTIFILVIMAGMYKFNYLSGLPGYDVDGNKISVTACYQNSECIEKYSIEKSFIKIGDKKYFIANIYHEDKSNVDKNDLRSEVFVKNLQTEIIKQLTNFGRNISAISYNSKENDLYFFISTQENKWYEFSIINSPSRFSNYILASIKNKKSTLDLNFKQKNNH